MHHENGGRVRRAVIGVIGLGSAVTIGVIAFSGPASATDDCGYYCPETTTTHKVTTTTVKATTTEKSTTTTEKATTTEKSTTTTAEETTSTTAGETTSTTTGGSTPTVTVLGETVTQTPVSVQAATAARPATAVEANVAFAG
jgi:hypothetical protein